MSPTTTSTSARAQRRRAGLAAFVGTTVEWYDFYIYSTAAALVFGPLFFPSEDPVTTLAAAFATYAIGFLARPLGAVIFGRMGDRIGRRPALVATMILMGFSTVATGLLPTFESVGVLAPVLLVVMRFIQGVSVGGEWGGAVLIAVEHAPEKSKTVYGSFAQLGNPMGAMLATGVFSLITMAEDDLLMGWGWRIPFLLSAVLIVVGLIIRMAVEESPTFTQTVEIRKQKNAAPAPGILHHWRILLLAVGMVAVPSGAYYISSTYLTAFATEGPGSINATVVLQVLTIGSFCELLATVPIAWLGDRFGRVRVFAISAIGLGLFGIPLFLAAEVGLVGLLIVSMIIIRLAGTGAYAALATIMAQAFPAQNRYQSISLAYQAGAAIFGGFSPLVSTLLFGATGTIWSVILLMLAFCVLSVVCARFVPQIVDEEPVTDDVVVTK